MNESLCIFNRHALGPKTTDKRFGWSTTNWLRDKKHVIKKLSQYATEISREAKTVREIPIWNKWSTQFGKKMAPPPHMDGSMVFARWCQCAPPSNTCFLGPTQVHIPNGISISSATFAQLMAETTYTLQWAVPFPLKISTSHREDLDSFLGPTDPSPQFKWHLDQFSHFCRARDHDRDRPTHRPHYSICNNRPPSTQYCNAAINCCWHDHARQPWQRFALYMSAF